MNACGVDLRLSRPTLDLSLYMVVVRRSWTGLDLGLDLLTDRTSRVDVNINEMSTSWPLELPQDIRADKELPLYRKHFYEFIRYRFAQIFLLIVTILYIPLSLSASLSKSYRFEFTNFRFQSNLTACYITVR
jgi:hypothetical protein